MGAEREVEDQLTNPSRRTRSKLSPRPRMIIESNLGISIALTFLLIVLLSLLDNGTCTAKNVIDCTEPEIDFPVQFTSNDKPNTKDFLTKVIRKSVINGTQYIEESSPDFQVSTISDILAKEYNCQTGATLSGKEVKTLVTIMKHIYADVLRKGALTPLTENEINSLTQGLGSGRPETVTCRKAISDLAMMMATTVKESVKEKIDYETAIKQRDARTKQCHRVAMAVKEKEKTEFELKRKREVLEYQKIEEQKFASDLALKRKAEELKLQKKESERDEKIRLDAEATEQHEKTLALEREHEERLKAEVLSLRKQTDELEREQHLISSKIEFQRQLEAEKDRQKMLQDQIEADKERQLKLERQRQLEAVQVHQKQLENEIAEQIQLQYRPKKGTSHGPNREPMSFEEAVAQYGPIEGLDFVMYPPLKLPAEKRYIVLEGFVQMISGKVLLCNVGGDPNWRWGLNIKDFNAYVPRQGEHVKAIGKITSLGEGKTLVGKPVTFVVITPVAFLINNSTFYH